jgi:SnoaL-like polyketide cyclase
VVSYEDNKDLVRRFWEDAFGKGELDLVNEILASDCKLNSADDRTKTVDNPDGIKSVIHLLHEGFSDMQVTVKDQIA